MPRSKPGSVFGDVVSVFVAVKRADGAVFWIGGESKDVSVRFETSPPPISIYYVQEPPTATVTAVIESPTGHWREGVPDVGAELEAGAKALPAGDLNDDFVRVLLSSFGPIDNG